MMSFNDPFETFADFFDNIFTDAFNNFHMIEAVNSQAPKIRREVCSTSFPPSSYSVDDRTKSLHIVAALAGLSEKDISLDYDNDLLKLTINKQKKEGEDTRAYYYKNLRLVEDDEITWRVDRGKFDIDKTNVKFENGLLEVVIPPTEAAKPKQKKLFGKLDVKALEDKDTKQLEDKSENKED